MNRESVPMQGTASLHKLSWSSKSQVGRLTVSALCASLVVALAAHVAFPLPFTPVPFTLQPLAVLGVGLALDPAVACLAMLAYLGEGTLGLPVFSPTGPGSWMQLVGPTGGFLLAYPAVAALASWATRQLQRHLSSFSAALLGCSAATALLFFTGACWLGIEAHLSLRQVVFAAVLPFLPGEAVKVCAAAGTFRALRNSSSSEEENTF